MLRKCMLHIAPCLIVDAGKLLPFFIYPQLAFHMYIHNLSNYKIIILSNYNLLQIAVKTLRTSNATGLQVPLAVLYASARVQ